VSSASREGLSSIFVEFSASADSDRKVDELKDKIDEAKVDLPGEAEDPVVTKIRFSDEAVLTFALSGPFPVAQLKTMGEDLKSEIERISGVSRVVISGGQEREVQVIVRKDRLDTFGLSLGQVTGAIASANADIPTGSIETAGANYNVRLEGKLRDAGDVSNIPIGVVGGSAVFVKDVADVIDGYQEKTSISRLSVGGSPPLPSISLNIFKTAGGNIIQVADSVLDTIGEAEQNTLPKNIQIEVVQNTAEFIRNDLQTLSRSGLQTILLLVVLLLFFLGWREALLAGIALPLTFLLTFIFLSAVGSTLNFLSLFALILSLGILIDSAIVMVEGMHEQIHKRRKSTREAAIATLRNFHDPLLAGTLTTVFAFAPMLLMSGILGEFVKHIPITIIIVLSSSLFVAFALIPVVGMKWLRPAKDASVQDAEQKHGRVKRFLKKFQIADRFGIYYEQLLDSLLQSKKAKRRLVAVMMLLFVGSLALPLSGFLPVNMFPSQEFAAFFIDVSKPIGTPLQETSLAVETIEKVLQEDNRVESFVVRVGSSAGLGSEGASSGSHLANVVVNLVPIEKRDKKSYELTDEFQSVLAELVHNADVSVIELSGGPPSGAPILVTLKGDSLAILEELARDYEKALAQIPGAVNIQTSVPESAGEFVFEIDRGKAQLYGVHTVEVARVLRNAISGTKATVLRGDGKEMDVVVKYALNPQTVEDGKTNIIDVSAVESLTIATPAGDVPLSAFTKSELKGGRPVIRHVDGDRVMQVTSETAAGVTAQQVFSDLKKDAENIIVPPEYEVKIGGETEDLQQSYNDMFRAMIFAVFLIGGVLVLQFRSFRQPWFILAVIPLSLIGVFPGLVLTGLPLSFPGIIGVVALTGIVVNDAIILLARANSNRKDGMNKEEAIREAGRSRLQPILLTTITTAIGIIPITISSELWASLGVSIIFGLLAATVVTLFVVPMLYLRFAEKHLEAV
jgi:multidrug efflux pump subunit AcrB